jgi:hypothetical protein
MPDYGKIVPVATLAAGTITPLVLTLGTREPVALFAGVVFAAALVKCTIPYGPPPKSYDKTVEDVALKSVVMTSSTNRFVRLALGSVYLYAAITFAIWMTKPNDSILLISRLQMLEINAFGVLSLTWVGVLINFFVAGEKFVIYQPNPFISVLCSGIWLSSSWCGT